MTIVCFSNTDQKKGSLRLDGALKIRKERKWEKAERSVNS